MCPKSQSYSLHLVPGDPASRFPKKGLGHQRSEVGTYAVLRWHVGKTRGVSYLTSDNLFPLYIDFHFKKPISSQPKMERDSCPSVPSQEAQKG